MALPPDPDASFREIISAQFGPEIAAGSAISYERYFRDLFAALRPRRVLEIGTRFGLSSALFARLADSVVTIDIEKCPPHYRTTARQVWDFCETGARLRSFYAKGQRLDEANASKRAFIRKQTFDFCFVDGRHDHAGISFDFACVKRCGCILFHDYKPATPAYADCGNHRMPDVANFVDTLWPRPYLIGPQCSQMALWIRRGHPLHQDPVAARYLAGLPRTAIPPLVANVRQLARLTRFQLREALRTAAARKQKWHRSLVKRLPPRP